jgi:hypothetical protein
MSPSRPDVFPANPGQNADRRSVEVGFVALHKPECGQGEDVTPRVARRGAGPLSMAPWSERCPCKFASLGQGKQSDVNLNMWKGWAEMADIYKFSDRVIDAGERLADVADAVQGRGIRRGRIGVRWLLLPAAGAGLYALATSGSFTRQAKSVMNQAKERASDLPDDLVGRVQQTTGRTDSRAKGSQSAKRSSASRTASQRRQKTSSR